MNHQEIRTQLFAEFETNKPQGCTCRPVYNTAGYLERGDAEKKGCPLHCTHHGMAHGHNIVCGCSYEGPY